MSYVDVWPSRVANASAVADERAAHAGEAVLAMVSHDLQDPLSTIVMAAELLLDDLVPSDDTHFVARRQIAVIRRAADRMQRLTADLLDKAALDAGQLRVTLAPHTIHGLLIEARELLEPMGAKKQLTLEVGTDVPMAEVLADRDRLLQVFANIGGNAVKFTPAGGRVAIRADLTAADVVFEISDTGPGIDADDLPHLFDRFWQARRTARLGTGLGLAIAKGIVEAHGGRIEVRSVVGVGSTFRFAVPLVPTMASPRSSPSYPCPRARGYGSDTRIGPRSRDR
jgi:signal transduction histidine kinase